MKININLATRPFADFGPLLKRLRIAMAVFAVVSIGLGFGLHFLHTKAEAARARERTVDTQVTKINQERQGYETLMRLPDNAQVLNQAHNLNALFDQKAFSWTLAMEDLETVVPGGVQVTTLEPVREDKTGEITLKLRVVGPRDKAVVQLAENLEHSRHFLRPAIVGESSENTGGPGQPVEPISMSNKVNVDLTAEYNPATLSELPPVEKKAEQDEKPEKAAPAADAPAPVHPGPAAGPGLRRPPMTGVTHPPAVTQPPAAAPGHAAKPAAGQTAPPVLQSPQAMRQAGQRRYPTPSQTQPAPNAAPRPRQAGPGGPQ
jgi:type IV pilus assembly protein PilN